MEKKESKLLRRIVAGFAVAAAACMVGYFAFCYWLNASGSLVGGKMDPQKIDQGSAVVVDGFGRREGVFTLYVGATDEEGTRTDSMMVLVFDTKNHKAQVINIPRDTFVDTERHGAGRKINSAYGQGIDEQMDEVADIIGFRPDKYLIADFDGIAEIVDAIGGVNYDIPFDMSYHDASQDLSIEFKKGMQHLDGKKVVEFLRWRHNDDGTGYDDGDIGRVEKLQTFLGYLGKKVLSVTNIMNIPSVAAAVSENVETDLSTSQILWVGMQAMQLNMEQDLSMQTLIGDNAMVNVGDNLWFYILDKEMIIDQINTYFNPFDYPLTEENFNIITPDDLGIYSQSWEEEKAYRYATYEKEKNGGSETGSGSGSAPEQEEDE